MPLFHCGKNSSVRENVVNSQAALDRNKNLQNNRTTTTLRGDLGVNTPPSRAIQQTKEPLQSEQYLSSKLHLNAQQYTLLNYSYLAKGNTISLLRRFAFREQQNPEKLKNLDVSLEESSAIEKKFINQFLQNSATTDITLPLLSKSHKVIESTRGLLSDTQQIKQLIYQPEAKYFLNANNFDCIRVSAFNHRCQKIASGTIDADPKSFLRNLACDYVVSDIVRGQLPEVKYKLELAKNKGVLNKEFVELIDNVIHNVEVSLHNMDNEKRKVILEKISMIPQEERPINNRTAAFLVFKTNPKIEEKSDDEIENILKALKAIPLALA